ncbi:MAG: M20/M25/M40 family metallo-hydrolase [Oscillospiraceae bacterium]|nr:M20/M25/M40 family metallo-hydrolase [Oscillospiraceae bacterium]
METFDTFNTLKRLTEAGGVSGDESAAANVALELLKEFAPDARIDCHGSVIGFIGQHDTEEKNDAEKRPVLFLDAHIDRIGLIVTDIDEKGFIRAGACGGIDRRALAAQAVTICGNGGKTVKGVICTLPPHVKKDNDSDEKRLIESDEIWIDAGLTFDRVKELVSPGATIVIDGEITTMLGKKVSSPALDNRAGVCAVLYALHILKAQKVLKMLRGKTLPNISVSFSVQEEVGCRGAAVTAYNAAPDYAVVVDVSYGMSPGLEKKASTAIGELGKGPMIGYAPSLNRKMFEDLKQTATEQGIPYQLEIMHRDTSGTNADPVGIARGGIPTALVSIPLRYMHTPVEVVDLSDIESSGELIAGFIDRLA